VQRQRQPGVQEVFDDVHLALVVMVVGLFMLMQRLMSPPCEC
jgi:hypothetical protein